MAVSPTSFRLKPGQTATYSVTVTNVGAPVGEWRFGSLTWSDKTGQYDVYSPIAVRGSLFNAPTHRALADQLEALLDNDHYHRVTHRLLERTLALADVEQVADRFLQLLGDAA